MEYKPDEQTLIGYLYGELEKEQYEQVQQYLNNHPEDSIRLQGLADTRKMFGNLGDKEVIIPPVFLGEERKTDWMFWLKTFRIPLGVAASFFLILLMGKLLGTEITYSNGELLISFSGSLREQNIQVASESVDRADIQKMIDESLDSNTEALTAQLSESQNKLSAMITETIDRNSAHVDELVSIASSASEGQVREYVSNLQTENLRMIKDYLSLSATEQREYMEGLLVDFAGYLQNQRQQDLVFLQSRVNNIEANTSQLKQETEQILAGILSNQVRPVSNNY